MFKFISDFVRDESGLTLIEYGLTASLVSLAGLPFFGVMGENLNFLYGGLDQEMETVNEGL